MINKLLWFLIIGSNPVFATVSLSISDLGQALKTEDLIVNKLDESLKDKPPNRDFMIIKKYITDFKDLAYNMTDDFKDPVQAYLIVKLLTDDFESLKTSVSDKTLQTVIKKAVRMRNGIRYPTAKDLDSSAQTVIRLQQMYDLSIKSMLSMPTYGRNNVNNLLGVFDFFRMASQSLMTMDMNLAIEWFETGLKTVGQDSGLLPKATLHAVKEQFNTIKSMIGSNFESFRQQLQSVPDFMIDALALQVPGLPVAVIKKLKSSIVNAGKQNVDKKYKQLCQGKDLTNDVLDEDKLCTLMMRDVSDLISPYKVEIVSTDPAVFVVYNFIANEKHVKYLNQLAANEFDEDSSFDYVHGARTSLILEDSDDVLHRYTKELNRLSGLETKQDNSDHVNIFNYGIGGYEDYLKLKQIKVKDSPRATVQVYLNEVSGGGLTVLPGLRLSVKARQGSAVFYYHRRAGNFVDSNSFPASCPVISGSKWVLNKEIR